MTDTLSRPRPRPVQALKAASRPGLLRAGLPAAGWALAAGFIAVAAPVLVLWAADSRSGAGAGDALRTVGAVWLLAHGGALDVPGGVVDLVPLGLVLLPLLLLERAARHASTQHAVDRLPEAARLAAGVAGPYALALTVVAGAMSGASVHPDPVQTLLGASVVGLLGAGVGVLRGAGLLQRVPGAAPSVLRRAAAPAGVAVAGLVGVGALLVGLALLVHLPEARHLADATTPGRVGGAGLLLLGALLAPTAAVWGVGYLAGPGAATGVGTSVSAFAVHPGPVPDLPLLAALPAGPLPRALALLLLLVPVAIGMLAARTARRRQAGAPAALLSALLAAAVVAALAALSDGALGPGHLSAVGPSAGRVGAACAAELLAGIALELALARLLGRRSSPGAPAGRLRVLLGRRPV